MPQTNLSAYNNSSYKPGGSVLKRILWYYVNIIFFNSAWLPVNGIKTALLNLFGAKIGCGVVIKPNVSIKYAWNLNIGNHSWIGEGVWIDNLVQVTIGDNACVSQGAILQTGSHNYKKTTFDLITGPITLQDGVWIGCAAIINQGVTAASHSVLTSGSVASKNLEAYTIYQGNPATAVRTRIIK